MGVYVEDGKYKIRVRISGKLVRRVIGPVNKENKVIAESILRELKNELAVAKLDGQEWQVIEKLQRTKAPVMFVEAAERFMNECRSKKNSTIVSYESILNKYLIPRFSKARLHDIDVHELLDFQAELQTTKIINRKGERKLAPARVNGIMQLLRTILATSLRDGLINVNPSDRVRRVQRTKTKVDPLTTEELGLALAALDSHWQPLFTVLAYTGARPNEIIALRWSDVDFRRKEIHISKGLVRGHEGLPKSESAQRVIPMVPPAEAAFQLLRAGVTASIDRLIFTDPAGKPILKHLDRHWTRALKKCGIRHRPSYQLRHTFASHCLLQGMSPGFVSKLLGHATLDTMYRYYARFIEDASKENESRLMAAFATTKKGDQLADAR